MNITIDGIQVEFSAEDTNIVEAAGRSDIRIPAQCYLANRKHGCCKVCVIEVNGEEKYACVTKPQEGMQIVFDRDDLNTLRKERIVAYSKAKNDPSLRCECDCAEVDDRSSGLSCC